MKLIAWGKSDTGRQRDHNEDSFLIDGGVRLFAVADGMGGHRGGATASRMALEVLQRHVTGAIDNLAETAAQTEADKRISLISERDLVAASDLDTVPALRLRLQRAATEPVGDLGTDPTVELITPPALTVMRAAAEEASFEVLLRALLGRDVELHRQHGAGVAGVEDLDAALARAAD